MAEELVHAQALYARRGEQAGVTGPPIVSTSSLDQINVKINQAKIHLATLNLQIRAYIQAQPFTISTRRDPSTRRLHYFVQEVKPLPTDLSAVVGDVLQNLRSALDHVAYQLVLVGTSAEPSGHVYFPIADSMTAYERKRNNDLRGARSQAVRAVDGLRPYKDGNLTLWQLHKLNIVDKHRALITAGSAYRSVNLGRPLMQRLRDHMATDPNRPPGIPLPPPMDLFFNVADRQFPLSVGTVLMTDLPDAEPSSDFQFQLDVAFGEPGIINGEPIAETLMQMVAAVESAVASLAPHLT